MTLDMNQLVNDYVAADADGDWFAISDAIVNDLAAEELEEALRWALPHATKRYVQERRKSSPKAVAVRTDAPAPKPTTSPKVQMIRDHHAELLGTIYKTPSGYKPLGSFTLADIQYQADLAQERTRKMHRSWQAWKHLESAMQETGAATLSDLGHQATGIMKEIAA